MNETLSLNKTTNIIKCDNDLIIMLSLDFVTYNLREVQNKSMIIYSKECQGLWKSVTWHNYGYTLSWLDPTLKYRCPIKISNQIRATYMVLCFILLLKYHLWEKKYKVSDPYLLWMYIYISKSRINMFKRKLLKCIFKCHNPGKES